nr:diacylglycerol kinase family protein [uncultured Desulfobulbus sp.]
MRFGLLYFVCALLALIIAFKVHGALLLVLMGWIAVSFLLVSLAYFSNMPKVFRKKSNGRIPLWAKVAFIPFLLTIHLYNRWARAFDKVPSIQKIDPRLYIGDRLTAGDAEIISQQQIKAVLDLTAEFEALDWELFSQDVAYLNIPILDHSIPHISDVHRAVLWIHNQQQHNGPVLVNCALGRGRSALVVAAFLLSLPEKRDIAEVLEKLRSIRQTVRLNRRQLHFLRSLAIQEQLDTTPQAWIIANPVSGGGKWQQFRPELLAELSNHYRLHIHETSKDLSAKTLAARAVSTSAEAVIACGGDGTVSEVASQLIHTKIPLGIVAAGTTNALAHVLMGVKAKLLPVETACDSILENTTKEIDTAQCNGHLVLLLAGIGFEQRMIEMADREAKNEFGQLAYLHGFWQAIQNSQNLQVTLTVDEDAPFTITTNSLVVANAAPLTTILAQGKGSPNHLDGLLDVTWIDAEKTQGEHLSSLLELALSGVLDLPSGESIRHLHAKKISLAVEPKCNYVIDGEVFAPEDLEISINPRSLRVFC